MHEAETLALRGQLRQLKPRLRQNAERQAARERAALLGEASGAREQVTALREAERGTQALTEAAQSMRRVRFLEERWPLADACVAHPHTHRNVSACLLRSR